MVQDMLKINISKRTKITTLSALVILENYKN